MEGDKVATKGGDKASVDAAYVRYGGQSLTSERETEERPVTDRNLGILTAHSHSQTPERCHQQREQDVRNNRQSGGTTMRRTNAGGQPQMSTSDQSDEN